MKRPDLTLAAVELFKALGSPTRLAILRRLEVGPACVHELVTEVGASQSLVSQHLRVLQHARLLRSDRRGKEIEYSLIDDHVSRLVSDALAHVNEQKEHPAASAKGGGPGSGPADPRHALEP